MGVTDRVCLGLIPTSVGSWVTAEGHRGNCQYFVYGFIQSLVFLFCHWIVLLPSIVIAIGIASSLLMHWPFM